MPLIEALLLIWDYFRVRNYSIDYSDPFGHAARSCKFPEKENKLIYKYEPIALH